MKLQTAINKHSSLREAQREYSVTQLIGNLHAASKFLFDAFPILSSVTINDGGVELINGRSYSRMSKEDKNFYSYVVDFFNTAIAELENVEYIWDEVSTLTVNRG